jgi:hypothetical protein
VPIGQYTNPPLRIHYLALHHLHSSTSLPAQLNILHLNLSTFRNLYYPQSNNNVCRTLFNPIRKYLPPLRAVQTTFNIILIYNPAANPVTRLRTDMHPLVDK